MIEDQTACQGFIRHARRRKLVSPDGLCNIALCAMSNRTASFRESITGKELYCDGTEEGAKHR